MIINTGCRTDIPAFYSKWLINRIKEGFVLVRNPYYPSQVTRYSLSTDIVDCLAFCTKNPEPMLKYLDDLDIYKQYWFVTITPYEKNIEPVVPDKAEVIDSFKKLSNHIGVDSIGWRYDPIFINNEFDTEKHIECFKNMASRLKGYTHNCTISFLDLYEKVKRNAPDLRPPTKDSIKCKLEPPKRRNLRQECNCLMGNDIGSYNTCGHFCKYCYANANKDLVIQNMKKHNENSPFLIGNSEIGDKITEAKQKSWIVSKSEQISFI